MSLAGIAIAAAERLPLPDAAFAAAMAGWPIAVRIDDANAQHYERTALDWLGNLDEHRDEIARIFAGTYGREASLWMRRWRLFFLATAGLFGHAGGEEWGVSHYLLRPAGEAAA